LIWRVIIFPFPIDGFRGRVLRSLQIAQYHKRRGLGFAESRRPMHKTNSILMHAPKMAIFETAANLELWPKILPHYRYIRYLERGPDRNVVVMAARRSGIPISWTSEQLVDRDRLEIHFLHLKAWTKGMRVAWTFSDTEDGVLVTIAHDLRFRVSALGPVVSPIIGDFFIHNVANKTLRCMKAYVEARADKVTA
jgi:ribosome-associated toxin RatA of RatAB toxin-antitoxin module